jgi:hypothetical protein
MTRDEINEAIKGLEEHAETENEMHLINYLKLNLANVRKLEDLTSDKEN